MFKIICQKSFQSFCSGIISKSCRLLQKQILLRSIHASTKILKNCISREFFRINIHLVGRFSPIGKKLLRLVSTQGIDSPLKPGANSFRCFQE